MSSIKKAPVKRLYVFVQIFTAFNFSIRASKVSTFFFLHQVSQKQRISFKALIFHRLTSDALFSFLQDIFNAVDFHFPFVRRLLGRLGCVLAHCFACFSKIVLSVRYACVCWPLWFDSDSPYLSAIIESRHKPIGCEGWAKRVCTAALYQRNSPDLRIGAFFG